MKSVIKRFIKNCNYITRKRNTLNRVYLGVSLITIIAFQNCSDMNTLPKTNASLVSTNIINPKICSENGITANIGEVRRFYLNTQVSCGQNCDSVNNYIDKRCEQNGQYALITSASSDVSNYRSATCTSPSISSCTGGGGGTGGSGGGSGGGNSGGSSTLFQQPNCVAPSTSISVSLWNSIFGRGIAWPSFGKRIRLSNEAVISSFRFTATNVAGQFGTIDTSDYPGEGAHGTLLISISKTPGCIDPQKLPQKCVSPANWLTSLGWCNGNCAFSCNLTPGETYYVNIFWGTTQSHSSGAQCPLGGEGNGHCGRDIQNQIQ